MSAAAIVSCTALSACSSDDDSESPETTLATSDDADGTASNEAADHTCNSTTLELEQVRNEDGDPSFNIPIPEGWETFDTGGGPDDGSYYPEIGMVDRDEASRGETTMFMFSAKRSPTGGADQLEKAVTDDGLRVTEASEPTTTCGYPAQAFTGVVESDSYSTIPEFETHVYTMSVPVDDQYVVAQLSVNNMDATTSEQAEGLGDSDLDFDQELFDQIVDGIQIATQE